MTCTHDRKLLVCPECVNKCCAANCTKPLSNKFLPFCDECMKKSELLKAWEET